MIYAIENDDADITLTYFVESDLMRADLERLLAPDLELIVAFDAAEWAKLDERRTWGTLLKPDPDLKHHGDQFIAPERIPLAPIPKFKFWVERESAGILMRQRIIENDVVADTRNRLMTELLAARERQASAPTEANREHMAHLGEMLRTTREHIALELKRRGLEYKVPSCPWCRKHLRCRCTLIPRPSFENLNAAQGHMLDVLGHNLALTRLRDETDRAFRVRLKRATSGTFSYSYPMDEVQAARERINPLRAADPCRCSHPRGVHAEIIEQLDVQPVTYSYPCGNCGCENFERLDTSELMNGEALNARQRLEEVRTVQLGESIEVGADGEMSHVHRTPVVADSPEAAVLAVVPAGVPFQRMVGVDMAKGRDQSVVVVMVSTPGTPGLDRLEVEDLGAGLYLIERRRPFDPRT